MTLELPWPPSVNHYYRHIMVGPYQARTIISRKGREFRELAIRWLAEQGFPRGTYWCGLKVSIDAHEPNRRERDLDNLQKPLLDALVAAGVIGNDSQVNRLEIQRAPIVRGGLIRMVIEPWTFVKAFADAIEEATEGRT